MSKTLAIRAYPTNTDDDGPAAVLVPITPELARDFLQEISEFDEHKTRRPNLIRHEYRDYTLTALEHSSSFDYLTGLNTGSAANNKLEALTSILEADDDRGHRVLEADHFDKDDVEALSMPKEGVYRVISEDRVHWEGFVKHTSIRWETTDITLGELEELSKTPVTA